MLTLIQDEYERFPEDDRAEHGLTGRRPALRAASLSEAVLQPIRMAG